MSEDPLTLTDEERRPSKIFVFCNSHDARGEWHGFVAIAEDGHVLAEHVCSAHGWAKVDLGAERRGAEYDAHYPGGWELVFIEQEEVLTHPGLQAAYEANQNLRKALEESK